MRAATPIMLLLAVVPAAACGNGSKLVCGEIVDDSGIPVGGATVTPGDGAAVTTDTQGRFCVAAAPPQLRMDIGAPPTLCPAPPVKAAPGDWVKIELKRRLSVPSLYQVGFDAPVTLTALLGCGEAASFTFRWEQIDGPALGDEALGWETPVLAFRTHPLSARAPRPGPISLSPHEAGWYRFRLRATSGKLELETEAEVTAASVQSGVLSIPIDTDAYFDAGPAEPDDLWKITAAPPTSSAVLLPVTTADEKGGVVRLRPDRQGAYELRQPKSGLRLVLEAGSWNSVPQDCDRPECHPSEHRAWQFTAHAKALSNRLVQPSAKPFGGRCLTCHTVGYNPGAASDGFDDVAAAAGIVVTDGFPGGADAIPSSLKRLSRVWCIGCHGPGRLPEHGKRPMTVKAGICAQCHDDPPDYTQVGEWKTCRMSKSTNEPSMLSSECSGCHTAQGAVARMRGRIVLDIGPDLAEPVTCAVCHVAHTENQVLLRLKGTAVTADGLLYEAGRGAACIGCHQAGQKLDEAAAASRLAPMASQSEILLGGGAWGVKGKPANINPDLCIDCHMAKAVPGGEPGKIYAGHSFKATWKKMIAPSDCDGDGVAGPLDAEVTSCMEKLLGAIRARLGKLPGCGGAEIKQVGLLLLPVGPGEARNKTCEASWFLPKQTPLYKISYNYLLAKRDGGKGAHNPEFTILILRRALEDIQK